jgi:hypothetical protein
MVELYRQRKLIRPPELFGNPVSRLIQYQAGVMGERNENLALQSIF